MYCGHRIFNRDIDDYPTQNVTLFSKAPTQNTPLNLLPMPPSFRLQVVAIVVTSGNFERGFAPLYVASTKRRGPYTFLSFSLFWWLPTLPCILPLIFSTFSSQFVSFLTVVCSHEKTCYKLYVFVIKLSASICLLFKQCHALSSHVGSCDQRKK